MNFSEFLIIEQTNGWWVMREGVGLGPYPSKAIAKYWATSGAAGSAPAVASSTFVQNLDQYPHPAKARRQSALLMRARGHYAIRYRGGQISRL